MGKVGQTGKSVRPRPKLFQALGRSEPPARLHIAGEAFRQAVLFKHDSWAATALYEAEAAPDRKAVVKFHRQQALVVLPMRWAGRAMARHEAGMMRRLGDVPHVPKLAGPVTVDGGDGTPLPYAVARWYIPGHPLAKGERVDDRFFPAFRTLLDEIHRRGMAYVDLHKRENVIVGDADGAAYLVDFQIGVTLPRWWPVGALLRVLQRSDDYHLAKHWAAHRPEQCGFTTADLQKRIPWWIKAHRLVARPFRECRRRLLVALKVRSGRGRVETEFLPEDAVRAAGEAASEPSTRRAA
jgi:hypothetical protein